MTVLASTVHGTAPVCIPVVVIGLAEVYYRRRTTSRKGDHMAKSMEPLMIEVRLNEWKDRDPNPNIPFSPEEIGMDAALCVHAGASIVHYHARDANGGRSMDPVPYSRAVQEIKKRAGNDVLVMPTLGMDTLQAPERMNNLKEMKYNRQVMPDLVPIDVITCNSTYYQGRREGFFRLTGEAAVYENTPLTWTTFAEITRELGLKAVPILWDVGSVRNTEALVEMELLDRSPFCEVVLTEGGFFSGHPGTLKGLQALLDFFPSGQQWRWTALLWGGNLLPVAAAVIGLGGHVSIGLGDYHYRELQLPTNAALVDRVKQIADAIGRPVASPTVARQMLMG
jgi:3-keto-5-aminohexanoate cleavage enzyme